jgi:hypothetical protein
VLLLFIVLMSVPRLIALFRNRSPEHMRYFECTPTQRGVMGLLYFSLMAFLYLGMVYIKRLSPAVAF